MNQKLQYLIEKAFNRRKCHTCGNKIIAREQHVRIWGGSFNPTFTNLCSKCIAELSKELNG